jgi:hypothetical protein
MSEEGVVIGRASCRPSHMRLLLPAPCTYRGCHCGTKVLQHQLLQLSTRTGLGGSQSTVPALVPRYAATHTQPQQGMTITTPRASTRVCRLHTHLHAATQSMSPTTHPGLLRVHTPCPLHSVPDATPPPGQGSRGTTGDGDGDADRDGGGLGDPEGDTLLPGLTVRELDPGVEVEEGVPEGSALDVGLGVGDPTGSWSHWGPVMIVELQSHWGPALVTTHWPWPHTMPAHSVT